MHKIEQVTGPGVPLLLDDIDTDRIIPARFLRCVSFDGIGEHAFEDDRKQDADHPFNKPKYRDAKVLLAGRNFGCGSSREHAPQSLMRWGIGAVVAESLAEIFFGNCTSLGIPAVCASREHLDQLGKLVAGDNPPDITVDLNALTVTCGDLTIPCTIHDSARDALVTGQWDFLGQLLEQEASIRERATKLPYVTGFAN